MFNYNDPILFVLVGIIVAVVLAQSVFFLVKAWKRGLRLGMDKKKLRKIARTAAIFTVAPAVAIVISVIALSKKLGIALPWLRLSVVGSLSYETIAAENTALAMGMTGSVSTASQYVTISLVMTISILVGIWLVPVLCKKMQKGMSSLEKRDKKWADVFQSSLFIGMISAFVGYVFCNVSRLWTAGPDGFVHVTKTVVNDQFQEVTETVSYSATSGLIPVCVMAVAAVVMAILGLLAGKFKKVHWISDYALPFSLIAGMASAIPVTAWLG